MSSMVVVLHFPAIGVIDDIDDTLSVLGRLSSMGGLALERDG